MARPIPLDDQMYVSVNGEYVLRKVDYIERLPQHESRAVPVLEDNETVVWEIGSIVPRIIKVK